MANSSSSQLLILPDILGLFVLAVQLIILFRWLVPDDGFRLIYGVLAYIVLAALALYAWRGKRVALKVSKPAEWAATVGASVLLGAVSFGIDVVLGSIHNPGLSPLRAGTRAGSPFGFPLTVFICPGFTMVAVAGLIRSFLTRREHNNG